MDQNVTAFTGLDPDQVYGVAVSTETLTLGMRGPASARVPVPALTTTSDITIAASVVVLATVLIVTIAVTIAVVTIKLSHSRRSTLDLGKEIRSIEYFLPHFKGLSWSL